MVTKKSQELNESKTSGKCKIVAVVSGKGGSGKTMLAVTLAQGGAVAGRRVVLVDTDFATGGLTFYLTFREFGNVKGGLSEIIEGQIPHRPLAEWASVGIPGRPGMDWLRDIRLVSIGDQRRVRDDLDRDIGDTLKSVFREAEDIADLVIVDCRGGIDKQSLEVCDIVDGIVIVVETDATSIRASQHLADVLSDNGLKGKVDGFILNKVMDDPTSLAKTASSLLGVAYLGAIPFDIDATRSYIQGRIPDKNTLFARHVFSILPRISPLFDEYNKVRVLSPEEFGTVSLRSPESRYGGIIIITCTIYATLLYTWMGYFYQYHDEFGFDIQYEYRIFYIPFLIIFYFIMIIFSLSDRVKITLGRVARNYLDFFLRSFRLGGKGRFR